VRRENQISIELRGNGVRRKTLLGWAKDRAKNPANYKYQRANLCGHRTTPDPHS
jgi:hypothetical protein